MLDSKQNALGYMGETILNTVAQLGPNIEGEGIVYPPPHTHTHIHTTHTERVEN